MMKNYSITLIICVISVLFVDIDVYAQETGTYIDSRDNLIYKTVKISNQVWMAENLNASHFRNGDPIPEAKTDEEWQIAGKKREPAWCYYDNDIKNKKTYGKLYNWYVVNDPRGLAPEGWHIPSADEWIKLVVLLSGDETQPGGKRTEEGSFKDVGNYGYWWCSKEFMRDFGLYRSLFYESGNVKIVTASKQAGIPVRCLKD